MGNYLVWPDPTGEGMRRWTMTTISQVMKTRIYKREDGQWCVTYYEPTFRLRIVWPCSSFKAAVALVNETADLYQSFPRFWKTT